MVAKGPLPSSPPHPSIVMVTRLSLLPPRFPELESPGLSKILRSAAFVYPFLFDNLPLFYRVRLCFPVLTLTVPSPAPSSPDPSPATPS